MPRGKASERPLCRCPVLHLLRTMHAALHAPLLLPGASLTTGGWGAAGRCSASTLPLGQASRRCVAARAVGRLSYVSADGQLIEISEDDAPLEVRCRVLLRGRCQERSERARSLLCTSVHACH